MEDLKFQCAELHIRVKKSWDANKPNDAYRLRRLIHTIESYQQHTDTYEKNMINIAYMFYGQFLEKNDVYLVDPLTHESTKC